MRPDTGARIYRALLRVFPAPFRRRFGHEMSRLFSDRLEETQGRPVARALLWTEAMWDLAAEAAGEWGRHWAARDERTTGGGMDGMGQDLKLALRALVRRPGFTATVVGTLGLGMGAVVALFSVVNGVLLRPLPYPDSDRIAVVWKVNPARGDRSDNVDPPDVQAWREALPDVSFTGYSGSRPTLTGGDLPEVVEAARVTGGILRTFGLSPALGRDLEAADDDTDAPRVVLLSHAFWTDRLGADPGALGSTLELSGQPWTVVGVAPPGFAFPNTSTLWMPLRHDGDCNHGCNIMRAVARVADDAGLEGARARMAAVDRGLAQDFPDSHRDIATELEPLQDVLVGDVQSAMWVLLAAVVMVLLIACANVANLMLIRAAERRGEVAVRAALGASPGRMARSLFAEAMVLSGLSCALALLVARWGVDILGVLAPADLPRMDEVTLDGPAILFALGLTVVVSILFGTAPALAGARAAPSGALRGGRRTEGDRRGGVSRSLLLTAEVALSLTLLLGAGLMFRTLQEVRSVELGYRVDNVDRFRIALPDSRYDADAAVAFLEDFETRLAALPGAVAVGHGFGVPLASGNITVNTTLLDRPPVPTPDLPETSVRIVSAGYLEAAGIPLRRGRWIADADDHGQPAVAVVNEAAVRAYWSDADPLGKQLELSVSWGWDESPAWTVVGVVGDVRGSSPLEPDVPAVYLPNAQMGLELGHFLIHRAEGVPSLLPEARVLLRNLDPQVATTLETTVRDAVDDATASTRYYLTLLSVFSAFALVLAAVGLYGVVAYAVSRRTREIGIRRALGAEQGSVVGMMVRQGATPALVGVVLALGASWLTGRALEGLLYQVEPHDPVTMVAVTTLLLVVVLVATVLPARRASRVPPASALRTD